jgi:ubiquinone/menaquinone biosynthesis C-methylase UbiE
LRAPDRIARLDVPRVVELSLAGLTATNVLDVGTGTGVFAAAFVAAGLAVTGIDTNADLLAVAREFAPAAQYREAPAEQIPSQTDRLTWCFSATCCTKPTTP